MIEGSFSLGGRTPAQAVPGLLETTSGNHLADDRRGSWAFFSDSPELVLSIPSRDKTIRYHTSHPSAHLSLGLSEIDSLEGKNYRAKLLDLSRILHRDSEILVNNVSESTHGSLALVVRDVPLFWYGLQDLENDHSYLVWSTMPCVLARIRENTGSRFLIYRFPTQRDSAVFLPSQAICSRWSRFHRHGSILYSFNAIERRLF